MTPPVDIPIDPAAADASFDLYLFMASVVAGDEDPVGAVAAARADPAVSDAREAWNRALAELWDGLPDAARAYFRGAATRLAGLVESWLRLPEEARSSYASRWREQLPGLSPLAQAAFGTDLVGEARSRALEKRMIARADAKARAEQQRTRLLERQMGLDHQANTTIIGNIR